MRTKPCGTAVGIDEGEEHARLEILGEVVGMNKRYRRPAAKVQLGGMTLLHSLAQCQRRKAPGPASRSRPRYARARAARSATPAWQAKDLLSSCMLSSVHHACSKTSRPTGDGK